MLTLAEPLKKSEPSLLRDLTTDGLHVFTCLEDSYTNAVLVVEGREVKRNLDEGNEYCQVYVFSENGNLSLNMRLNRKIKILNGKITIVD